MPGVAAGDEIRHEFEKFIRQTPGRDFGAVGMLARLFG